MFVFAFKTQFFPNYVILAIKGFLRLAAASVYHEMLQLSSQRWSGQAAPILGWAELGHALVHVCLFLFYLAIKT